MAGFPRPLRGTQRSSLFSLLSSLFSLLSAVGLDSTNKNPRGRNPLFLSGLEEKEYCPLGKKNHHGNLPLGLKPSGQNSLGGPSDPRE